MEKRLLLAIVLSFLILFLYQLIFVKKPQPETTLEPALEEKPFKEEAAPPAKIPSVLPEEKKEIQPISEKQEKQILIETSLYQARWSNKGAVLKSWKLKDHKGEEKEDLEIVPLLSSEINSFPLSLWTDDPTFNDVLNSVFYKPSVTQLELTNGRIGEIRFEYSDGEAVWRRKRNSCKDLR